MDSCPYYFEQARGEGDKRQTFPCCKHKHSPVPCLSASLLTQLAHVLKCKGRLGYCQIPPHEQLDIA
jgi:hypothetical protein